MSEDWSNARSTWQSGPQDWNDNGAGTDFKEESTFDDTAAHGDTNGHDGDQNGGPDGGCHNCGQEGHFSRECPEPRKQGACFNCGEEGHSKAECTKPRVFKGACNMCGEEGHPAARCPTKPKLCARCKQAGDHDTKDCKNNFYLDLNDVPDLPEGVAWSRVVDASLKYDLDDFKDALRILQKAAPSISYCAIEKKLRAQNLKFYLIGLKKEIGDGYTLVDLQGVPDKSFTLAVFKSPHCQRPNMAEKWPESPEVNLARLTDTGIPIERGIPYCRNCESFGHATRECDQDRVTAEPQAIICALCGEQGHRVRACTEPRKKPRGDREPMACRICGGEHMAKECDQKPAMKCRNCDQEGHKASDCTEPRKIKCVNCDEEGHLHKECPKPKDWTRFTCRHCGEKGHLSATRCAPGAAQKHEEAKAESGKGGSGNNNGNGNDGYAQESVDAGAANGWGHDNNAAASGGDGGWETGAVSTW